MLLLSVGGSQFPLDIVPITGPAIGADQRAASLAPERRVLAQPPQVRARRPGPARHSLCPVAHSAVVTSSCQHLRRELMASLWQNPIFGMGACEDVIFTKGALATFTRFIGLLAFAFLILLIFGNLLLGRRRGAVGSSNDGS